MASVLRKGSDRWKPCVVTSAAWSGAGDERAVCMSKLRSLFSLNEDISLSSLGLKIADCLRGCEAIEVMLNLLGSTNSFESFVR